ncbi:MAG: aldo/keto reductase [Rhodospirillales bacterium]|nr:aldo/keto reductase [Rhodospirillales bacterium]
MRILDVHGAKVPALGFGTWRLRGRTCREMVRFALEIGYRHIDTAAIYGNEEEVGEGIAESGVPRDEIFLVTKVWSNRLSHEAVLRAADESLTRLGTDYIDLFLIHWPSRAVPLAETMGAMSELKETGKIRHIGGSNFNVALMRETIEDLRVPIVANQVEYHPYLSQNHVLAYCREAGITLTAYCPVAEGRVEGDPNLRKIGQKHGRSATEVTLRWLLDQELVSVIPMTANPDHCRANLEVFDFALDTEDRATIASMAYGQRLIDMHSGYAWDPE